MCITTSRATWGYMMCNDLCYCSHQPQTSWCSEHKYETSASHDPAFTLVPFHTAWWQRHSRVYKTCPRLLPDSVAAGSQTHYRVASPMPYPQYLNLISMKPKAYTVKLKEWVSVISILIAVLTYPGRFVSSRSPFSDRWPLCVIWQVTMPIV